MRRNTNDAPADYLRKLANGQPCLIRVPGVCNFDPATTVGCHFRLVGESGIGFKPTDLLMAWGCSACHAHVDTHHDIETQRDFALGVFRTLAALERMGCIKVAKA